MCYRYSLQSLTVVEGLRPGLPGKPAATTADGWKPRYNVALTNRMPVLLRRSAIELESMSFGLVLAARTPAGKPVVLGNARAETLLDKPALRDAALHRRCLVPADGFYEWEKRGADRLPHYFFLRDHRPFFFAGIWEPARDGTPAAFAIVTTTPNALLRTIHNRMPVVLGPNSGPAWLGDQPLDPARLNRLCRPLPAEMMAGHRVDPRVNHVRHDAPDCIAPLRCGAMPLDFPPAR